jgi:3-hydroxyisobutyrate dehydrogenase
MNREAVALLGLGLMGTGMARNLLRAGHPLSVYNRSRRKAEVLEAEGARVAATPREAAEGAEVVISIVADDEASRQVWLGENGALAGLASGGLGIESSTLTVEWVRELAGAAAERGVELLDAPVTGSKLQAAGGELLFLVGGSEAGLQRARAVLEVLGRDIVHLGPSGSGTLMKLINNFTCGVQAAALAEAAAAIEAGGLDSEVALRLLVEGAPGSPLVGRLAGRMASREYEPHFALSLMVKDLDYARAEIGRLGVPMRTVVGARQVFIDAVEAGHGDLDVAAIVEPLRAVLPARGEGTAGQA